ncbi:hypothetical protein G6O67_001722 [Ophiocordyceps sinensis]|uniref:Uncharacterized protein n=1 Tax=Ophiocordyceps sinensis TaxID=72228 RepID=A0A8H4PY43_9HYPO|nr:hypothetical protein G6O67_001722 [Ophiocordyceps sinensis]
MICFSARSMVAANSTSYASLSFWRVCRANRVSRPRLGRGRLTDATYDIGQLRLGHQVLSLGPNKLLLQDDQLGALGLLALELGDLVGNLDLAVAARLDALFCVANRLEAAAGLVEGVRVRVLLLAHLAQDDANLVRDVVDSVISRLLAPVGELLGDGDALTAGRLVSRDEIVFRLDEAEQLARQLRLDGTAERVEGEAGASARGAGASARGAGASARGAGGGALVGLAAGADGEGAVPAEKGRIRGGVGPRVAVVAEHELRKGVVCAASRHGSGCGARAEGAGRRTGRRGEGRCFACIAPKGLLTWRRGVNCRSADQLKC